MVFPRIDKKIIELLEEDIVNLNVEQKYDFLAVNHVVFFAKNGNYFMRSKTERHGFARGNLYLEDINIDMTW